MPPAHPHDSTPSHTSPGMETSTCEQSNRRSLKHQKKAAKWVVYFMSFVHNSFTNNQIHQNQMHIHQIQSLHVIENGQVASGSALRKCCQSHGIGGCYPRPQWHIAKAHCLRHLLGHFTLRKLVFPGLFLMMILVISSGRVW